MKTIRYYFIGIITVMMFTVTSAQAAFDDAGTDYTTDTTDAWIDMGPSMEPLNFTSMLVCIMKKSGASQVVNGTYIALVDMSKCETGSSSSKPQIAKATVTTSRADNSSPQIIKVWFDAGQAQYLVETTVTEGVSSTAPYGSFTFSWQSANDATEKGTMTFTAGSTSSIAQLVKYENSALTWLNGIVNNDKTTGEVRVGIDADTYKLSFNATHVNTQKGVAAEECFNRTSFTEYVHGYNIYDQGTGAKKTLSGPFRCTYDSSGSTKQCYIGPYGAWFEGGETNTITSVTHENGTVYSPVAYPNNSGNDGVYVTVSGYTFDDPVIFAKAAQSAGVQAAMGAQSSFLEYFGEGSLYGLPWQCSTDDVTYVDNTGSNCSGANYWRPAQKLTDGTVITDNGSTQYVVKAKYSMKVMDTDVGNCSALDMANVSTTTYPALTTSDITAVSITWADKPTVTAAPSVIDGVVQ